MNNKKLQQKMVWFLLLLFMVITLFNFGGCCSYSFTGASVPAHLNTISIPMADDRSGRAETGLREEFTDELIQKFIRDNSLQITERANADALLECSIIQVVDAPNVVTSGEQVNQIRVTISVQAVYRDMVKRSLLYEKTFSNYGLYSASGSIDERRAAISDAISRITEDILLETVSGW
jgi:hypothetical protein